MLSSEEISADHIKSGFGGYNKKATRKYLDGLREEYDSLYKENVELKDKLSVLSEGVQYYKNMEKSLQKALVLAERTTSETIHAAEVKALAMEKEAKSKAEVLTKEAQMKAATYEKEAALKADAMIRDAKQQADVAISQGNEELRRVHSQIMTLIQQYEQYKTQYKQLALAQMNVLESEAYTLQAPILKTIQGKLDEMEGENSKGKQKEEEHIGDSVVHPIPSGSFSTEDNREKSVENEEEKKMFMDGRGQVYEVHDFREVSISGSASDEFEDVSSLSDTELDGKQSDEKQPDEYFKAFDTPDSKQMTEQEEHASMPDTSNQDVNHAEETEDSYAAIKRIEKMQMERLRREQEQQAEFLKNQNTSQEWETQNFEEKSFMEKSTQMNSYQEEPVRNVQEQKQPVQETDDFLRMLHKDDDEPINLSDLKHMETENQGEVPLPKASEEEKDYFSEFPKEMKPVSFDENAEESSDENANEASSYDYSVNKEQDYKYTIARSYENATEKNSLSYEMDHGNQYESTGREKEGFKSFRDFESEL